MAQSGKPERTHEVTIVSDNPETLDSLQSYLRAAGVSVWCTRELGRRLHAATRAFIVFPDDFRWEQVVATLAELATQCPGALPVLVTAQPQRFERLNMPASVLLLPRPVWGWTLLEAIRGHASQSPGAATKGGPRAR